MAPSRRARSPGNVQNNHRDAADTESEEETPRPHRSGLKKRLSEIHPSRSLQHDDDGDFNPETGRPPLRAVNINDDAAEKRRRRKSTKLNMIENPAGPSGESQEEPPVPIDPARAAKQKLNTVAAPAETVPFDVMSSNFEEWMKMATDNVSLQALKRLCV